ncbi:MAG: hypothetical protein AAFU49_01495 [Pseudomonadota bacterium]
MAEQIPALAEEVAEIRRAEVDILRALAAMRLGALQRDEVRGRLDQAEQEALEVLETNRARLAEIETARSQIAESLKMAEARRATADDDLNAAHDALEAQIEATEARLADVPDWQAASLAADRAAEHAEGADRKAERAEADRAEKSAAYEGDPLFTYLWERRFGTSDYQASNLVKYVDSKVARLIGYSGARADYHRLTEIPLRLREHADRLAAEQETAVAAREALERDALEADGIVALERTVDSCAAALDDVDDEIDRLEAKHARLDEEAAKLTDPEGEGALSNALSRLADTLGDRSLAELAAASAATQDDEDDRLVAQLAAVRADIAEADRALRSAEAERAALSERRARLEADRRRFRHQGYNAPGGSFDNSEIIGELVGGIVRGALAGGLSDALSSGYRRPRRKGRSGFGGSASRPRATRSRSSGGFRTGGSF